MTLPVSLRPTARDWHSRGEHRRATRLSVAMQSRKGETAMRLRTTVYLNHRRYDQTHSREPRQFRRVCDWMAANGMRFTGITRWIVDGAPCRVLTFTGNALNPHNYPYHYESVSVYVQPVDY